MGLDRCSVLMMIRTLTGILAVVLTSSDGTNRDWESIVFLTSLKILARRPGRIRFLTTRSVFVRAA
jgi:hypothetical protein